MRSRTTAGACVVLLALTACSADSSETADPTPSAAASAAPEASTPTASAGDPTTGAESSTDRAASRCKDGVCLNPDATYADFDAGRDLTLLEQALMRRPGPYAGESFDKQAVWDAVVASEPTTAREWAEAILTQIHGDYAEDAQDVITFNPTIEGVPAEPTEKVRGVEVVGRNHFAIVLDASGSMAATSDGQTRMAQAKDAIRGFVGDLPDDSTVSLRIYGHKGSNSEADKALSCAATAKVYDGPPGGLPERLQSVRPVGWTPLARAVRAAADDIPKRASDAIVYVVTDGLETCGGRPVAATRTLASRGVEPVVNVVGFHVGDARTRQLRAMARAGNGAYTEASSQRELERYWEADVQAMMDAWRTWKDEALDRIEKQGQANMRRAEESGQAVMATADLEWDRAQQITGLMAQHDVDYDVRTGAWNELYDRHKAIWGWGYDNKTSNWSEAYEQKNLHWSNAYNLGSQKWSEYYRRSVR